jgi:hypothetical protein
VQLSAANDALLSLREHMGRPGAQPPAAPRESKSFEEIEALAERLLAEAPPPPSSRTNRTRRVPHLVQIGHAASLTSY